jgi:hypothetical protein
VPLRRHLERLQISRRDVNDDGPLLNTQFSHYLHPFNTLPLFETHLRPQFVIFNSGSKLRRLAENSSNSFRKVRDEFPVIQKIIALHSAWCQELPITAHKDPSYWVPDDDFIAPNSDDELGDCEEDASDPNDDDYGTNKTKSGRGNLWVLRQQAAAEKQAAAEEQAPPAKHKRKVHSESLTHNQQLLSEKTLYSFNQQMGEVAWTNNRIREWSKKVFRKKRKLRPPPS